MRSPCINLFVMLLGSDSSDLEVELEAMLCDKIILNTVLSTVSVTVVRNNYIPQPSIQTNISDLEIKLPKS